MSYSKFRVNINPQTSSSDNAKLITTHPSLAYLAPPQQTIRSKTVESNDDSSNQTPTSHPKTATHLRTLTAQILEIIYNAKDYTHPVLTQHLLPTALPHKHSPRLPYQQQQQKQHSTAPERQINTPFASAAQVALRAPNLHAEILRSVARVQANGLAAEVWTWMDVSGLPVSEMRFKAAGAKERVEGEGIVKESVVVLRWEWREEEGEWVCVRLRMVRGVLGV